jgi:hypothetical protein
MTTNAHTAARNAAIREAAALADSIIDQRERLAKGWDQNGKRDDEPNRTARTRSPYQRMADDSAAAFKLAAQFHAIDNTATPVTDTELRAAADRAMVMARDTLAGRAPFLGVFAAAEKSGIADGAMARICGWAYLAIIQQNTTSITTNLETEMLVSSCLNDAGRILAAQVQA